MNKILTSASCLPSGVSFRYANQSYYINLTTNEYYSTFESMFDVYLGLQNKVYLSNYSLPTVKMSVLEFRKVSIKICKKPFFLNNGVVINNKIITVF